MNELATIPDLSPAVVESVEGRMLELDQPECPVTHRIGNGIYIREVTIPAGTLAIGHHQNFTHWNIMLEGRCTMLHPDGSTEEFIAPRTCMFPPGRKIGIIHERVVWQNIYPSEHEVQEVLESKYITKSSTFLEDQKNRIEIERFKHEVDRKDFLDAIAEIGFSPEQVQKESEQNWDLIDMPDGECNIIISESPIAGKGVFSTKPFQVGDVVAIAKVGYYRTPVGRYTNHSASPNCEMMALDDRIVAVAIKTISGCLGGRNGDEITVDYRRSSKIGQKFKELCHH